MAEAFSAGGDARVAGVRTGRPGNFLLDLSDRLRRIDDPLDILGEAAAAVGAHLGASRAGYAEVEADGDTFVIERDWTDGTVKQGTGRRSVASFGPDVVGRLYGGETLRIEDAQTDPRVRRQDRAAYDEMQIEAAVTVPLVKDGRLVAMFSVQKSSPRAWTDAEVALVEDVAERTWAAHQRARTEVRLRETQARQAFLLELGDRLREEVDPHTIIATTNEALGRRLGALRVGYGEVDSTDRLLTFTADWTDGVISNAGTFELAAFGEAIVAENRAGRTFACADVTADPRIAADHVGAFTAWGVGAIVAVPLVKAGRFTAVLSVQSGPPRAWTEAELGLIQEVAERTWATLERARTAEALRSSEAQLRLLADNMDQLAWIADAGGSVIWANRRWSDYTGAPAHALASDGWLGFVRPEGAPELRARLTAAFGAGEAVELTAALRRADGAYRSFLLRVLPERGPGGEVAHWLGTGTDISEQLETETHQAFLLGLEDRLRSLHEPGEILYAAAEAVGRHLGLHRAGYSEVDPRDDCFVVCHDWVDGPLARAEGRYPVASFGLNIIEALRRREPLVMDDVATDPRLDDDARAAYTALGIGAIITVPLVKDEALVAIMTVNQATPRHWSAGEVRLVAEIAERTWSTLQRARAETELRESQALLAAFMANAPVGMYLKDEAGRYVMANAGMERIFGRPPTEAIGLKPADLFDAGLQASIAEQDARAFAEGRAQLTEQHLPGTEDGSWTLLIRFPVDLAEQGRRIGGFAIDVTDQKRAEAELQRSREALYQSEKLTALGSLLAGVSHELNNPLAVVVGQSMILEEDALGTPVADRAGKIRRAAERCAKIVQTFLAMARQRPPARRPVDANAVVQAALDLTAYGMRSAGIAVACDLATDLPRLDADADQLHQVFANLLVNAQQALQDWDGDRRLTVATRPGRGGTVEVEIADNGPGIAPELRNRVMEPFFTTKPQGMGTGLGLSYSLGVVEAHGGRLEVIDRPHGAAFRVTLPAGDRVAADAPADAGAAPEPAARGHALVVDDEPEIADMIAELLEGQGYRVRVAATGADAKRQMAVRDFDLVLSDLRMPDTDGSALHAWIAAERPQLLARLGFITGDTMGPNAGRFLAEAGRPHLEKPFTPSALRAFVARLLGTPSTGA